MQTHTMMRKWSEHCSQGRRVQKSIFYQDAEVPGDFTRVGYIADTEGLKEFIENNAVVEGWGNKVVSINYKR